MAANPWTPTDDQHLRDMADATPPVPVREQAKQLGRTLAAVARRRRDLGITSDRTRTAAATQAKVADAKARRAALELRALTRVEHLYDRLEARTFTTLIRGAGAAEEEATLPFVPPADERQIAATISQHLNASLRIAEHDADDGHTAVIGMIDAITTAITAAADAMPDPEATP
ncbi:hypothetical protein CLV28_0700 [Sediminihabitans luteus]|uniref:Uncharacterized protein n=1 Tax=Sediminihabitans luteus TaxID=1138585 RepID=A0A2M9CZW0_9CELL|nr:histidine phosphatase family protein [Sediminihabitans luteus]PJJ77481.1 hypothetical protein CLV28_0700 [Sediminihabitans luteus]GII98377.1 hypothetical protein Slu03_07550 [Sediminihabitans luteus]